MYGRKNPTPMVDMRDRKRLHLFRQRYPSAFTEVLKGQDNLLHGKFFGSECNFYIWVPAQGTVWSPALAQSCIPSLGFCFMFRPADSSGYFLFVGALPHPLSHRRVFFDVQKRGGHGTLGCDAGGAGK